MPQRFVDLNKISVEALRETQRCSRLDRRVAQDLHKQKLFFLRCEDLIVGLVGSSVVSLRPVHPLQKHVLLASEVGRLDENLPKLRQVGLPYARLLVLQ